MNKILELKDKLYYDDLIYAVKKIAGWCDCEDKQTEERIKHRLQTVSDTTKTKDNQINGQGLTGFEIDLFLVIRNISNKAGITFTSMESIRNYPELVLDVLNQLSDKRIENYLLNHLKCVIKEMGISDDDYHFGESTKHGVCIFKRDNLWEVYVVERGISFEESTFEKCFDACIEVINLLADSRQMYEKGEKSFARIKKVIQHS